MDDTKRFMARDFRNGITFPTVAEDRRKPEVIIRVDRLRLGGRLCRIASRPFLTLA
jgi:hypothetical protein